VVRKETQKCPRGGQKRFLQPSRAFLERPREGAGRTRNSLASRSMTVREKPLKKCGLAKKSIQCQERFSHLGPQRLGDWKKACEASTVGSGLKQGRKIGDMRTRSRASPEKEKKTPRRDGTPNVTERGVDRRQKGGPRTWNGPGLGKRWSALGNHKMFG